MKWDESGEYWPATKPQRRVDWVQQMTRRRKLRWEESYEQGKGKAVCVLLSNDKLSDLRLKPHVAERTDGQATKDS